MTGSYRGFGGMLALTILAAALAGWFGVTYGLRRSPPDLDRVLHDQLNLSSGQEQQIEVLESEMATKRTVLRNKMADANHELSDALGRDHAFGSAEKLATEHFHEAMMELQQDTIKHVMSMRAVLNPDQARRFDEIIAKNLTDKNP